MATVLFDDSFTEKERIIFTKTFRANCARLDIANRDCTVTIRRYEIGRKAHEGMMSRLTPDHFVVALNSIGFNLFKAISVLGHEMVHVAQYLRGDLADDEQGCHWRGQIYPHFVCNIIYQDLPWEKEAFHLQPKLHKHSLKALHQAEMQHVIDASRFAYDGTDP